MTTLKTIVQIDREMPHSEHLAVDRRQLAELRRLVARGEGQTLEFKRKAAFPEKIVRELIAFANTDGGTLLVGVDDDGSIPGVKFPEEEWLLIENELTRTCRPTLEWNAGLVRISEKRFVLAVEIGRSERRPHFFAHGDRRESFIRVRDQTIRASREVVEIIRRLKTLKGMKFPYGEAEQKVIRFLGDHPGITVPEFAHIAGLNRYIASRKLVRLVLANVLRITTSEKGDVYSRA